MRGKHATTLVFSEVDKGNGKDVDEGEGANGVDEGPTGGDVASAKNYLVGEGEAGEIDNETGNGKQNEVGDDGGEASVLINGLFG